MVSANCGKETLGLSAGDEHTKRPFQRFRWCPNDWKRRSLFASTTKTSASCFHLGHNAGIIVEQRTLADRLIATYRLALVMGRVGVVD